MKKIKKYKSFSLVVCFLLFNNLFFLSAQELINVRIFSSFKIVTAKLFLQDDYSLFIDETNELIKLNKNQFYQIEVVNDSLLELVSSDGKKFKSQKIMIYAPDIGQSEFSLQIPKFKNNRVFKGNLTISSENGNLKLINTLDLDDYVCGVVNAEVGKGRHPEFYKAQALLVRTYALSHLYKHLPEGFNLCDQVHCQVYYGTCISSAIADAVSATHNQVIVDSNLNLIVAAFHSNSGGQTVNSEDIWGTKKDYLRSVKDTFSVGMPSYRWTKKIALKDWMDYLKKYKYPTDDNEAIAYATQFKQYTRQVYLQYNSIKIPLKNIRDELKLMSTFFDIELNETKDTVVFHGRGFGHGVGLSQEGAMRMAKAGLSYKDIIQFYYQNVMLIDLKKLNFFREE
ncbi:MAG: hypothetical protein KatS3mg027_1331 [Bacteroidia bacterium]|nr:MAG: hypothetical protein KatS3mg027_1331 [Bacteroidia bacterium]